MDIPVMADLKFSEKLILEPLVEVHVVKQLVSCQSYCIIYCRQNNHNRSLENHHHIGYIQKYYSWLPLGEIIPGASKQHLSAIKAVDAGGLVILANRYVTKHHRLQMTNIFISDQLMCLIQYLAH